MTLNWANRVTVLRILLIIPFVICMLKINDAKLSETARNFMRYASVLLFFIMAASDALDGFLARRKKQITTLGTFLDPAADKLLMAAACLLLASKTAGVSGFRLPPTVAVLIIGKDVMLLLGFIVVYFITSEILIAPVLIGKIATAMQLSMVAAILLAPEISAVVPKWIWPLRFMWWSAASTAILATLIYIRNWNRYIEEYEQNNQQACNKE
ncbi:MAG: CDP-alcohol phosphatidyltransferase family protein [Planctomycetes bacterium]|nr:CDP-alcohol phosphatidyltransferase family protein [Planctomycetota bacterium]